VTIIILTMKTDVQLHVSKRQVGIVQVKLQLALLFVQMDLSKVQKLVMTII